MQRPGEKTMENRVALNEEPDNMPVPEKCEKIKELQQQNGEQEENGEDKDQEESSLPAIGKLSLNVKAVPYIPKQDGAAFVPNAGDNTRSNAEGEPTEETSESLPRFEPNERDERETSKSQKPINNCFSDKKQAEDEPKDELREQVLSLKQNLKHYEEMIGQYQASEQTRKRDVDSALISAREVVERERREKLDVLSDQKTRREQLEHLSKTLNILQAENEELKKLRRQQDEKLAELTRLKTLIQENGFPNIDQFLMLQQQVDAFRDDFVTERKERERLQSQKDKMKRDVDTAQSRIASLQEQVYKYREHILFIQNKFKQSSPFRPLPFHDTAANKRPISANEACELYGPNATQYINHGLASSVNPASCSAGGDSKFQARNDKKVYPNRFGETSGRQWQDGKIQRQLSSGVEEWKRPHQGNHNDYFNNMNRLTTSNSAPSLAEMVTGEQAQNIYDKQFVKPGFQKKSRSSLSDDASKDFGMLPGDWKPMTKPINRFSSPLASPNLPAQSPEFWSPQQGPGLGFQKGWHNNQDEIFRFPSSPLSTPTSKASFDSWQNPSALVADDQSVFPPTPSSGDEGIIFPVTSPSAASKETNFVRFQQDHATFNGKVYVCYNCGINFDDNKAHRNHVDGCGM